MQKYKTTNNQVEKQMLNKFPFTQTGEPVQIITTCDWLRMVFESYTASLMSLFFHVT